MMKYFKGEIAGKNLGDLRQFDNSLTNYDERAVFVEGILENGGGEFFGGYFENYYDVSPNQTGVLAEDDAVCNALESLGTYLIDSKDVESHRKVEYRFWKDEREFKKYKESENMTESAIKGGTSESSNVEVIDMFVDRKNEKNQKIVESTSIKKEDMRAIEEIKSLQSAIEYLKMDAGKKNICKRISYILDKTDAENVNRLKYISKNIDRYIGAYTKDLRANQVAIKEAIKKPITFKKLLKDEGAANKLDAFDLLDNKHIKSSLEFLSLSGQDTELGILISVVDDVLYRTPLKKRELEIVDCFRKGMSRDDLYATYSRSNVNNTMNRIADKFVIRMEYELEEVRKVRKDKGFKAPY